MIRVLILGITCLFFMFSTALAEASFGDLEGSVASSEFTHAERRYFTDATNRFQKFEIQNEFKARSIIAWLDNDHIVFSARKFPGWKAKPHESSRIIALNVVTGEYIDSGYRGRLFCLNHLGDLMIRQGGDEAIVYSSTEKYQWLVGKWGHELSYTQHPLKPFIPNYLCRFSSSENIIYSEENEKSSSEIQRKIPLLPEHGYLHEDIKYSSNGEIRSVRMVTPDGDSTLVSRRAPQPLFFYFLPWSNEYFEKLALRHEPRIFHPTSGFSSIPVPKLLEYWSSNSLSTAAGATRTKAGMLWDVHQANGFWKKQGFYLDTLEGLLRIESGRGVYAIVSPNGCRIVDSVVRGDPYRKGPAAHTWLVIDICNLKN